VTWENMVRSLARELASAKDQIKVLEDKLRDNRCGECGARTGNPLVQAIPTKFQNRSEGDAW
jgi:hypothetical protein